MLLLPRITEMFLYLVNITSYTYLKISIVKVTVIIFLTKKKTHHNFFDSGMPTHVRILDSGPLFFSP